MKRNFIGTITVLLCFTIAAVMTNCRKADIKESTTDQVNILQYIQVDTAKQFSDVLKLAQKANFTSFLNAYGTYTFFLPTNTAVDAYLKSINKTIDQLSEAEAGDFLKLHMLSDIVLTSSFTDGKLPSITMLGQYLITGVANQDGVSGYVVNRQASITAPNIVLGNGVVHIINHVLQPATKTVAETLEADPDYSIFTQALNETGYLDKLRVKLNADGSPKWFTLLAESNKILLDSANIGSYAALRAKYKTKPDVTDPTDSLNIYVAYHILPDIKYLADIVMAGSHNTSAPLQVITDKVVNQVVLLNDDEFNGVHERGIAINAAKSDISATNGVMHSMNGHLVVKNRSPFAVYWDVAMIPELMRLSGFYLKNEYLIPWDTTATGLKDVKWETGCLRYQPGKAGYLGDYLQFGMGGNGDKCKGGSWIEFTTPLLVQGRYKVWICYRQEASGGNKNVACQVKFDSIPMTSALVQFHQKSSIGTIDLPTESSNEALGWKQYMNVGTAGGGSVGRMVGIADVKFTGRHKIRLEVASGSNGNCDLDMIHFIPIGMPQIYPKFNKDGTTQNVAPY
jgi:uncharacterized surface protein with fasciclin (FAS1) repeats